MRDAAVSRRRLAAVTLDEVSIARGNPDQEHERLIAIHDLLEDNVFAPVDHDGGPYVLHLAIHDTKLAFDVHDEAGRRVVTHLLSLSPFRRILKDYFLVCESYFSAIRTAMPSRIEAIDMGRRGLHDEAGRFLAERLKGKIDMDFGTARRLFTLVMALHWRG